MVIWRWFGIVLSIALVVIYAGGANYWNRQDGWYQSLQQPSWQPPDIIFGIIWPYNFVVLGIALYTISSRAHAYQVGGVVALFAASVFFALRWSYLFYEVHNLTGAATSLLVTSILTLPVLAATFTISWRAGLALIPYQIWVFTASALAHSYAKLN